MRYFYRIKAPKLAPDSFLHEWMYDIIDMGYIEAKNRKEAKESLEDKLDIPLCGRSRKDKIGVDNFFLLTLFEPNDYFDEMWLSQNICLECNKKYTKLDRDLANNFAYIHKDYCSKECFDIGKEKALSERLEKYLTDNVDGIHLPVIYKITNKSTKKCYIGKTTQAFTFRWYQHFYQSKKKNTKFSNAIINSKLEDWIFEVVETLSNDMSEDDIKKREQYWINKENSVTNGYNSINAKTIEKAF
jgi:hypothetical protein